MDYGVLGPLEVARDGQFIDIGARQQRAVLALLVIEANTVVSTDRIIDELWGSEHDRDRQNALWVMVSRLRSLLEPGREKRTDGTVLVTRPPGYVLVAEPSTIDAQRFETLAREGRTLLDTDPAAASLALGEALAMWRGRAYEEFAYEAFAGPEIARLEALRLATTVDRVDADLRLGRHAELVAELEGLVRQHPGHAGLVGSLMLALHRSGRQGDALRAFTDHCTYLAEEMGLDPSEDVCRLEERILLDDPTLRIASASASGAGGSIRGYELRAKIGEGRTGDVYAAFQPSVGRDVAVKVIRAELANDPRFIRRFESETRLIAQVEHPRIVPVYDFWREPDRAFLVMRRFERGSLRDVVATGPLDRSASLQVLDQVGRALAAAHRRGIPHGDLRPEKVLIDDEGEAYLANSGLLFDHPQPSEHPVNRFRAPETASGEASEPPADIYALGRLAEWLLGAAVSEPEVAATIATACAVDPADRFDDVESFLIAISAACGTIVDPVDAEPVGTANPYRGLRAFEEDDADRFFGRERLIERLLARLGYPGPKGRFVALVGPSGSGKSSVVKAGVLPALRRRAIPGSDEWFVVTMSPGRRPFEALADALRTVAVQPPADLPARIRANGIQATAEELLADDTVQLLVVIDQMEELFSQAPRSVADQFMDAIVAAVSGRHTVVKVIATLRADFYDHPLRHTEFGELVRLGTEVITPMNAQELERAITRPATTVGVTFEAGVVAAIADDMSGQATALPLMQYALTELFENRTATSVTIADYEYIGGVGGALARRADGLYESLDEEGRSMLRQALLRLVTLTDGSADTRRRALVGELNSAIGRRVSVVLDMFARHRLLSFDRDPLTRSPTVEIAHESLLTEWERLRRWIDEARNDLSAQRRLGEMAAEWEVREEDPAFLLGGGRLARYEGWDGRLPVGLTNTEDRFLAASRQVQTDEAATEARRINRLRRMVAVVGVALVVALAAGTIALVQRRQAQVAATEAVAQRESAELATLISRSAAVAGDDPEVALLLALEARRRAQTPQTDLAVLNALGGSTVANRVLTRERFANDCLPSSAFIAQWDDWEFSTADGRLLRREPLSGDVFDMGLAPGPCAIGARDGSKSLAVTPDLMTIWTGPDLERQLALDEPTLPLWSAEGRFLAVTGVTSFEELDTVTFRDKSTGAVIGDPIVDEIQISFAANQDDTLLAIGFARPLSPAGDGRLVIVDAATAEVLTELETPDGAISLRFDPSTGHLFAGFLGGRIMEIEPRTGAVALDIEPIPGVSADDVARRGDGSLVAVSPSGVLVVDPASGSVSQVLALQGYEEAFIRTDGLISVATATTITIHDIETGALAEQTHPIDPIDHVAFEAGLAAALDITQQTLTVIDLASGRLTELEVAHPDGIAVRTLLAYPEPDGAWTMSADHLLVRRQDGAVVDRLALGSVEGVTTVLSSRSVTGARFGDLYATLGLRPDGAQEATLVRLERGNPQILLSVDVTDAAAVHPSGEAGLIIVDRSGVVRTYGPDGELATEAATGGTNLYELALAPSGSLLAAASDDGGGYVVDILTGEVDPIDGIPSRIVNVGFNASGSLLALTTIDGTVRLWDVEQGEAAGVVWHGSSAFVGEPSWHDVDSNSMWMATSGRLIRVSLDPQRWLERACEIVARELTQAEWDRLVPGDQMRRPACG